MISKEARALKAALCGSAKPKLYPICEKFITLAESWDNTQGPVQLKVFLEELTIPELAERMERSFVELEPGQNETFREYLGLENRVVSNLTRSRVSTEDFYAALWEKLNDDALLSDISAKAAFLLFLRTDNRIPYYELDEGCTMDDRTYREVIERIRPAINKGAFILSANLQYKTQRASLLLDVANGLASEEERIVFWAVLLSRLRTLQALQQERDGFSEE